MGKGLNGCVALCICVVVIELCQGQLYASRRQPPIVPTRPCPPVCEILCENGNVLDANGCRTCACIGDIGGGSRVECPIGSRPAFPERSCATSQIAPLPGMPRRIECRRGDFCQPSPFDGPGRCCTRRSVKPRPPRPGGSRVQCPMGSRPAFPERSCATSQIAPMPGMPRRNECRRGDFCQPSPFDGPGRCCTRISVKPRPPRPGVCPRIDIITTCQVTIDHCFDDDECSFGQKCCAYGCGRRCMQATINTGY